MHSTTEAKDKQKDPRKDECIKNSTNEVTAGTNRILIILMDNRKTSNGILTFLTLNCHGKNLAEKTMQLSMQSEIEKDTKHAFIWPLAIFNFKHFS